MSCIRISARLLNNVSCGALQFKTENMKNNTLWQLVTHVTISTEHDLLVW